MIRNKRSFGWIPVLKGKRPSWIYKLAVTGNRYLVSTALTPHTSRLTPHASLLTPHASRLTPHTSRLKPHTSRLKQSATRRIFYFVNFPDRLDLDCYN